MFIQVNENPQNKLVGDCVIRAISTFLNQDWNTTYLGLAVQGYIDADLMSADEVWGNYLIYKGYERSILPHDCPNCLTVRDFAELHPDGKYLLFVGGHVVPVINGNYYDTYDSGDRVVIYFFSKSKEELKCPITTISRTISSINHIPVISNHNKFKMVALFQFAQLRRLSIILLHSAIP